jgi:hypothetical protein
VYLREKEERGKMKPDWAELYNEHVETYYKKNGKCQNPHCGHWPIHLRHVLRHKYSGETLEIGHICFLEWEAHYGLVENELLEYQESLRNQNLATEYVRLRGDRITGSEYARFEEETSKARRIKEIKKKGDLQRVDIPISRFPTEEEAEEYAEKYGGYCSGKITMHADEYWCLYIPKSEVSKVEGVVR